MLQQTNVTATGNSFGLLAQWFVSGAVYAQPLAVSGVRASECPGGCDVVYIATEDDLLYAFTTNGLDAWSTTPVVSPPVNLAAAVGSSYTAVNCSPGNQPSNSSLCSSPLQNDGGDYIGVTGTPVIDMSAKPDPILYVVGAVQTGTVQTGYTASYVLFAVDITSGAVLTYTTIGGSVQQGQKPSGECGTATGSGGISFTMNSIQRQGLLLLNGVVYVTFADFPEGLGQNGWIFGYCAYGNSTCQPLSRQLIASSTAFGSGGGFWGSGAAPASDGTSIFTSTGNGTFDKSAPRTNYGDSLLKLTPSGTFWPPADFFTPSDVFTYNQNSNQYCQGKPTNPKGRCLCDIDLSSGGVMLVPPAYQYTCTQGTCTQCATGSPCKIVITADKESNIYVSNQSGLGGFPGNGTNNNIEVVITPCSGAPCAPVDGQQGYWASPAYWNDGANNNWIFYSATDDLTGDAPFPIDGYVLAPTGPAGNGNNTSPVPETPSAYTFNTGGHVGFCQYSPTPAVSSGTSASSGIVWATEDPNGDNSNGNGNDCKGKAGGYTVLHAFCATGAVSSGPCANNALLELYSSTQNVKKTAIGSFVPFSIPTVFKGQVYMGTKSEVDVFGLCPSGGCPLQ